MPKRIMQTDRDEKINDASKFLLVSTLDDKSKENFERIRKLEKRITTPSSQQPGTSKEHRRVDTTMLSDKEQVDVEDADTNSLPELQIDEDEPKATGKNKDQEFKIPQCDQDDDKVTKSVKKKATIKANEHKPNQQQIQGRFLMFVDFILIILRG